MKFELGQIGATATLVHECHERYGEASTMLLLTLLLRRHSLGDWGDTCPEDTKANEDALKHGDRLLSIYHPEFEKDPNFKVYIITEWDRSVTTVMLASDY